MATKKNQKRGVSPLIATVLLISFAVTLGAVIINWINSFKSTNLNEPCSAVNIEVNDIKSGVCINETGGESYINFNLFNKGNINIDGLSVWIVGTKGTKLYDIENIRIVSKELLNIRNIQYDITNYGTIKHIKFIPKIKSENTIDICPQNSIRSDYVQFCN